MDIFAYNNYCPIYIATKTFQKRKNKKKRINKKWQKIYGYYEINMMPHDQVVMMDNNTIWMTKRTYDKLLLNKNITKTIL